MRRGRDSNPRYGFPYTHFPGVPLQPLEHLSVFGGEGCKNRYYIGLGKYISGRLLLQEDLELAAGDLFVAIKHLALYNMHIQHLVHKAHLCSDSCAHSRQFLY